MPSSNEASSSTSTSTPASEPAATAPQLGSRPPAGAVITDVALDRFAYETNGAPFPAESKEELKQFLDCDDQGRLTVSIEGDRQERPSLLYEGLE